jgi:hypothetical protein
LNDRVRRPAGKTPVACSALSGNRSTQGTWSCEAAALRRHLEHPLQFERGVLGDLLLAGQDLMDRLGRASEAVGEFALRSVALFHHFSQRGAGRRDLPRCVCRVDSVMVVHHFEDGDRVDDAGVGVRTYRRQSSSAVSSAR